MQLHLLHALWCLLFVYQTLGACSQPSPAFPLPDYNKHQPTFLGALGKMRNEIKYIVAEKAYDTTAFSIEVTSSKQTLWSSFHTARDRDALRPGSTEVNSSSAYRIASITKTFTTLGLLQENAAGNLDLDYSIKAYLSDLKGPQSGSIAWANITLRSLASQLSGLPRDCGKSLT
jgi:CubicO group peptidase (beta-lactamase class C family)